MLDDEGLAESAILAAVDKGILKLTCLVRGGLMEGTNNKIKMMKRMAYGYRDMEFFELKILTIHKTKYTLTG